METKANKSLPLIINVLCFYFFDWTIRAHLYRRQAVIKPTNQTLNQGTFSNPGDDAELAGLPEGTGEGKGPLPGLTTVNPSGIPLSTVTLDDIATAMARRGPSEKRWSLSEDRYSQVITAQPSTKSLPRPFLDISEIGSCACLCGPCDSVSPKCLSPSALLL